MRIWRSVWPIYFRGRTDYIYETTLVRKAFSVSSKNRTALSLTATDEAVDENFSVCKLMRRRQREMREIFCPPPLALFMSSVHASEIKTGLESIEHCKKAFFPSSFSSGLLAPSAFPALIHLISLDPTKRRRTDVDRPTGQEGKNLINPIALPFVEKSFHIPPLSRSGAASSPKYLPSVFIYMEEACKFLESLNIPGMLIFSLRGLERMNQ